MELTYEQKTKAIFIDLNMSYSIGGRNLFAVNAESIKGKIINVLMTTKGTYVFEPLFGANLEHYLQDPFTKETANLIESDILSALTEWVPEIAIGPGGVTVTPDNSNPRFYIALQYTIRAIQVETSMQMTLS